MGFVYDDFNVFIGFLRCVWSWYINGENGFFIVFGELIDDFIIEVLLLYEFVYYYGKFYDICVLCVDNIVEYVIFWENLKFLKISLI